MKDPSKRTFRALLVDQRDAVQQIRLYSRSGTDQAAHVCGLVSGVLHDSRKLCLGREVAIQKRTDLEWPVPRTLV